MQGDEKRYLFFTNALVAMQISKAETFNMIFSDSTKCCHREIQNTIIGFYTDSGFRNVTLLTNIIPEKETSEGLNEAIHLAFKQSGNILTEWRSVTQELFPDCLGGM